MPLVFPFRDRVRIELAASGANNLDEEETRSFRSYHYERVAVINETTDYTKLQIGVVRRDEFHPYFELHDPKAAILYPWEPEGDLEVVEGEFIRAAGTGLTTNDVFVMYVSGWYEVTPKPEPKTSADETEEPTDG